MRDDGIGDEFIWPVETIRLERHGVQGQPVSVEVDDCMRYLTRNADPIKILDDPLKKIERDLLWKLGSARSPIDIFDKETWGGVDYTPHTKRFSQHNCGPSNTKPTR